MKKTILFLMFLVSATSIAQDTVYEQTFVKAHNIGAYDFYIENVFSKVHKQRIDAGLIKEWNVWKVMDSPQEDFTHMITTVYSVDKQDEINAFDWERPEGVTQRDEWIRGKDLNEIREIIGVVKYTGLARARKAGAKDVPDYMAYNVIKLKGDKWKSYETAEINGTKKIGKSDLRVGWDFGRRIDDYGTDISHTHVTIDWYDSHADFLKTFMSNSPADASKEYQEMMKLRDLKYRVFMKKHKMTN